MPNAERERWSGRLAFIMAAIGSAVGLGNLWRFPAQAFQNGGGAFFIPYFIALISAGFPLVIVEYALGQRYQGGAPKALAAVTRKFKWVGWFALFVGSIIVMYYVVVMGYAWHYAVGSVRMAWTQPTGHLRVKDTEDGELDIRHVPPEQITVCLSAPNKEARKRLEAMQQSRAEDQRLPVFSADQLKKLRAEEEQKPPSERTYYVTLSENVGNYFNESVLGGFHAGLWAQQQKVRELRRKAAEETPEAQTAEETPDAQTAEETPEAQTAARKADALQEKLAPYRGNMFKLTPTLIAGAALTWIIIFLIIFKGVRNVGKVVMLTVPLPVALIVVMLIRGMTLPGAATGILYYLQPNWEMLKEPTVWIHAYGQIFFSLTLGFGVLIAYASYMPEESDVTNSALITSFGNCVTSFIAGLAVFSVVGYMAHVQGSDVQTLAESGIGGPGLVFVTYPIALAEMPMALWATAALSLMFFLCLITLGIDSAFSLVEGIVTGYRDHAPQVSKGTLTAVFCVIGFLGSLFICTRSGLMWLDILDNWMSNYGLALVGLMECIAVGYFFHISELKDYINKHSEIKVHYWFDAFIRVVTPVILIVLLGQQFLKDITHTYEGYDAILPHSVNIAGWGVFFTIFILSLIAARHWKMLAWAASALGVAGVAFLYFQTALPEPETANVTAASFMCGIAVALLFGGVITGIHIARKTHHMAGLSLEAQDTEDTED